MRTLFRGFDPAIKVLGILISAFLLSHLVLGQSTDEPRPFPPRLVVGSELDYPPFALVKANNEADGFTVELWNAVAREAGLDSTIHVGPFHSILQGFKSGDVDVMINLAQSAQRASFCSFAVPHVTMYGAIFVRRGDSRIRSEADLPGKTLIVLNRDLPHDYAISRGWTNHLILVDDTATGLEMLAAGKSDAMLIGKLVGLNTLREKGIQSVHPVGERLNFQQKFAFAVMRNRPGSADLLARINEGLTLVKANGTYDALYEKWFGVLEPREFTWKQALKYLVPVLVVALLATPAYATERRIRLRLNRAVSLLNATLESTADGIIAVDEQGSITMANRRLQLLGLLPVGERVTEGLTGRDFFEALLGRIPAPEGFRATLKRVGQAGDSASFDMVRLDDGRSFEVVSNPQEIDQARRGRVWSFRDVTRREQATERIRQFSQELEQKVLERTSQLQETSRSLERAVRSRDSFMAAMSHELRTPLHGILGLSELLLDHTFGPLGEKQEKSLRRIRESGEHLLELINDILDLTRIQNAGVTLELGDCDLRETCEAAIRLVDGAAKEKAQQVSLTLPESRPRLLADDRRLKQVLVNLLGNAVKFTARGGSIGLEVKPAGHEVRLEVWDTGKGIPPELMGRLFQPFVQLDERLSREHTGSGLGLALVRQLVEAHGGRVELRSEVGKGSRFIIALPWDGACFDGPGNRDPEQAPAEAESTLRRIPAGITVLVAEDNGVNLFTLRSFLESNQVRVLVAENGKQAVALALESDPDLILMDIQMAVMDGLEATARIRALNERWMKSVPIVAVTALAMPGDRDRCLMAGANAYMTKPLALRQLGQLIAELVEAHPHLRNDGSARQAA